MGRAVRHNPPSLQVVQVEPPVGAQMLKQAHIGRYTPHQLRLQNRHRTNIRLFNGRKADFELRFERVGQIQRHFFRRFQAIARRN